MRTMMTNLPENTFYLTSGTLPGEEHADIHGNVMYYCKTYGWMVSGYDEAKEMISDFNCTFWTFTPPLPT